MGGIFDSFVSPRGDSTLTIYTYIQLLHGDHHVYSLLHARGCLYSHRRSYTYRLWPLAPSFLGRYSKVYMTIPPRQPTIKLGTHLIFDSQRFCSASSCHPILPVSPFVRAGFDLSLLRFRILHQTDSLCTTYWKVFVIKLVLWEYKLLHEVQRSKYNVGRTQRISPSPRHCSTARVNGRSTTATGWNLPILSPGAVTQKSEPLRHFIIYQIVTLYFLRHLWSSPRAKVHEALKHNLEIWWRKVE